MMAVKLSKLKSELYNHYNELIRKECVETWDYLRNEYNDFWSDFNKAFIELSPLFKGLTTKYVNKAINFINQYKIQEESFIDKVINDSFKLNDNEAGEMNYIERMFNLMNDNEITDLTPIQNSIRSCFLKIKKNRIDYNNDFEKCRQLEGLHNELSKIDYKKLSNDKSVILGLINEKKSLDESINEFRREETALKIKRDNNCGTDYYKLEYVLGKNVNPYEIDVIKELKNKLSEVGDKKKYAGKIKSLLELSEDEIKKSYDNCINEKKKINEELSSIKESIINNESRYSFIESIMRHSMNEFNECRAKTLKNKRKAMELKKYLENKLKIKIDC